MHLDRLTRPFTRLGYVFHPPTLPSNPTPATVTYRSATEQGFSLGVAVFTK